MREKLLALLAFVSAVAVVIAVSTHPETCQDRPKQTIASTFVISGCWR